jgi:hypothetical protein
VIASLNTGSGRRATVFILSDVRSGSTILDQCLGGNRSIASLGELHWLPAYVKSDRRLYDPSHPLVCACGLPIRDCPFWTRVESLLGRPLETLRSRQGLKRERGEGKLEIAIKHVPRRLIKTHPWLYRSQAVRSIFDGYKLGRDCIDLYDAACAASGRTICVDSSKSIFRFRDVYELDPTRTYGVILVRNYKAVVHSKMKRGESVNAAANGWRRTMQQIETLTTDLPTSHVLRVRYEDFCESPSRDLKRLCRFLDVDFEAAMLDRSSYESHHLGGSPTKYDPSRRRIVLDRSHETDLAPSDAQLAREIVGTVANRWGY